MKNNKVYIAFLVIVILILTYFYIKPREINTTVEAVEYSITDSNYINNRSIRLEGKYYRRPFGKSFYKGKIIISGIDYTKEYRVVLLDFKKKQYNGILNYNGANNGTPISKLVGTIVISSDFSNFTIFTLKPQDDRLQYDNIITYPVIQRDEALALYKDFLMQYKYSE